MYGAGGHSGTEIIPVRCMGMVLLWPSRLIMATPHPRYMKQAVQWKQWQTITRCANAHDGTRKTSRFAHSP